MILEWQVIKQARCDLVHEGAARARVSLRPPTLSRPTRQVPPDSICFSTAIRCPLGQKSRVERLKAKVEPLLSKVTVETGKVHFFNVGLLDSCQSRCAVGHAPADIRARGVGVSCERSTPVRTHPVIRPRILRIQSPTDAGLVLKARRLVYHSIRALNPQEGRISGADIRPFRSSVLRIPKRARSRVTNRLEGGGHVGL